MKDITSIPADSVPNMDLDFTVDLPEFPDVLKFGEFKINCKTECRANPVCGLWQIAKCPGKFRPEDIFNTKDIEMPKIEPKIELEEIGSYDVVNQKLKIGEDVEIDYRNYSVRYKDKVYDRSTISNGGTIEEGDFKITVQRDGKIEIKVGEKFEINSNFRQPSQTNVVVNNKKYSSADVIPNIGQYKTNKKEVRNKISEGVWSEPAYGIEITHHDVAEVALLAFFGGSESVEQWVEDHIDRQIDTILENLEKVLEKMAEDKKREIVDKVTAIYKKAIEDIKNGNFRRPDFSQINIKVGKIGIKAGMAEYIGHNMLGSQQIGPNVISYQPYLGLALDIEIVNNPENRQEIEKAKNKNAAINKDKDVEIAEKDKAVEDRVRNLFNDIVNSPKYQRATTKSLVMSGLNHTCYLNEVGVLECWGHNKFGQIGSVPGRDTRIVLKNAIHGDAGEDTTCAVTEDHLVYCWGRNKGLILGNVRERFSPRPLLIPGIRKANAVAVGERHACSLLEGGAVFCWGSNGFGQLGNGTFKSGSIPVQVVGLPKTVKITAGKNHTCALTVGNEVYCWGNNHKGRLGNNHFKSMNRPVLIMVNDGEDPLVDIQAGGCHTCAQTINGHVYCWGSNHKGQLGISGRFISHSRVPQRLPLVKKVSRLSTGYDSTCIVEEENFQYPNDMINFDARFLDMKLWNSQGTLKCWGDNRSFQINLLDPNDIRVPFVVDRFSDPILVSQGDDHHCVKDKVGEVFCWGSNQKEQLLSPASRENVLWPLNVHLNH